jgi:hypothetical protein
MWKEGIVACFKVLSQTLLGGLRKTMRNLSQSMKMTAFWDVALCSFMDVD